MSEQRELVVASFPSRFDAEEAANALLALGHPIESLVVAARRDHVRGTPLGPVDIAAALAVLGLPEQVASRFAERYAAGHAILAICVPPEEQVESVLLDHFAGEVYPRVPARPAAAHVLSTPGLQPNLAPKDRSLAEEIDRMRTRVPWSGAWGRRP